MAGQKLSSKAEEEVVFLEHVLTLIDHLAAKTEAYAAAKKGDDAISFITRQLSQLRQNAMMRNLGPVADHAGMLGIAAGRGSQMQRTRTLREGLASYKQLVERTMKATADADVRHRALADKERAEKGAADRAAKEQGSPSKAAE